MLVNLQSRLWPMVAAAGVSLSLGACSSVTERTRGALVAVTPYKVEVVQGNFVSSEQVALLKPGQSRQQVREILGTSLLTDVFHSDRWDYVFTIRRQGVEPQQRRLTLFFKGELLDRFQGDEMPSEQDFVAKLDTRRRTGRVPVLEASEAQLDKVAPAKATPSSDAVPAPLPPLPASYPPLER
ncbi:outer membrane protein assembly factor BamE [Variovorax sp. PvP013]|jgi:outer membrane protein assembly factor BamE|uniref:outer membrane protein assembly factor BamE n=1 Tax=Variovorax sp. PvP013 TaxID=3156435 RepID=UPI003D220451